MKTITIILTSLLIFQVNFLFSASDGVPSKGNKETNLSIPVSPVTSKAGEVLNEEIQDAAEILILAPVTPKEASFEFEIQDTSIRGFAPITPAEADFKDDDSVLNTGTNSLAPVTPAEADLPTLP